ncbi:c-type cytochrome biogenesis protein CcmI [Undibacterium sp.]|uniref:c-type cytochrome biogenesis protein CcmI n=1 Tax=Undibacterium sp. TaxID=1914977 RepID=UPI0037535A70
MTYFVLLASLMTIGAILFVIMPLLNKSTAPTSLPHLQDNPSLVILREQGRELDRELATGSIVTSDYDLARRELERRVAEEITPAAATASLNMATPVEPRTAALLALGILILAGTLYWARGTPEGIDPIQVAAQDDQSHAIGAQQIEQMVKGLAKRLQTDPSNVEGWSMLARSYKSLGQFAEAAKAYEHLVELMPEDADLLASYADTLATARDNRLQGEPEQLINRALSLNPNNVKALALSGSAGFEREDYEFAIRQWQKMLPLLPPDSDMKRSVDANIEEAKLEAKRVKK